MRPPCRLCSLGVGGYPQVRARTGARSCEYLRVAALQPGLRSRIVTIAGVGLSALVALLAVHGFTASPDPGTAIDSTDDGSDYSPPVVGPASLSEAFESEATPLIRTDFSDDAAWQSIVEEVSKPVDFDHPDNPDPGEDAYVPYIVPIDNAKYEGVSGAALADQAMAADLMQGYVLLADARSMAEAGSGELTVDYVDLSPYAAEDAEDFSTFPGRTFRCAVPEVASIEANLSIANMDFHEFADSVAPDGVFRGFPGE